MKRGLTKERAWRSATNGRGAWWNAGASHMNAAFPKSFFDRMGLVSGGHLPALPESLMNRQMRNRTVRWCGRTLEGKPRLLPDL
jgi:hypothetical protein